MIDQWNRFHRYDDADFESQSSHRGAKQREQEALRHKKLDAELDRALEDSFPGSDPVSVVQPARARKRKR